MCSPELFKLLQKCVGSIRSLRMGIVTGVKQWGQMCSASLGIQHFSTAKSCLFPSQCVFMHAFSKDCLIKTLSRDQKEHPTQVPN